MSRTIVISLGGSLVSLEQGKVNASYLKRFCHFVVQHIKNNCRFIIVVGGGKIARDWRDAGARLGVKTKDDFDWIGIMATHLNAELVRAAFGKLAHPEVIIDPSKKIDFKEKILVASGWKPGFSTDYDAAFLAGRFGAKEVINLSNINFIYDKNPKKFKNAKPLPCLSWKEYFKIVGKKWSPGANFPFDPVASCLAQKKGIKVAVLDGRNLANFEAYLKGKTFKGTVIK